MRATTSLLSFNQKIMLHCRKLLIRITSSRPKRHYRHLKLHKTSSSSSSSRKKPTRVVASFFLPFQKKKEKMKRLNEHRSCSNSISDKKAESRKKAFPSSLKTSCIGQGKAYSQKVSQQDHDATRNSTSAFLT